MKTTDPDSPTVADLRSMARPGYNLAVEVPISHDLRDLTVFQDACPVLAEASGPLGVLRAMDLPGRRQGIQRRMADDGQQHRILHLVFGADTTAILHDYRFVLERD